MPGYALPHCIGRFPHWPRRVTVFHLALWLAPADGVYRLILDSCGFHFPCETGFRRNGRQLQDCCQLTCLSRSLSRTAKFPRESMMDFAKDLKLNAGPTQRIRHSNQSGVRARSWCCRNCFGLATAGGLLDCRVRLWLLGCCLRHGSGRRSFRRRLRGVVLNHVRHCGV